MNKAKKPPVRTISIPVAEVIEGGTKSEFYASLRKSLDATVRMANIAATECIKQDDLTAEKAEKLYTYPAISKIAGSGSTHAAAAVARSTEAEYKQDRWQIIRGLRSLRTYRSQPWPLLHNKSSNLLKIEDAGEFLTARLKLIDKEWTVRLAGGSNYRDQIRTLRKAVTDNSYGDSKIWIDGKHKATLGIACRIPPRESTNLSGKMIVSSNREHLLIATLERSDTPFVINADECKQWMSEANAKHQRLRQDRKSDANRRKIGQQMTAISNKRNARMKTLCHEVSARIINHAIRKRVATVELDLTIKSYAKVFPWFDLAAKIKYKAESAGIVVVDSTQTVINPSVDQPHVYFKYSPSTNRIKIGRTGRSDGGRHGAETDSPEELVILAVDNQAKTKLVSKEKHYHAMFQEHRMNKGGKRDEWFAAPPVLAWLREVGWLGNAGNLSQIVQVLDAA